ncbi:MAG TPA: OB-fold domain-containing protein [Acidimicrobiia bacterium]|nr:OB-fold domain-containing protein [Acidimicrobiia bacterium]
MADVARDEESTEFFDGTARGELMVKQCSACGHHLRPDSISCSKCYGNELLWTRASGRGTLVSWIVVHGAEQEPPVVGLVELDEGPWLHARLVDVDTATLAVGDAFVVDFEPAGEERIPIFRPA